MKTETNLFTTVDQLGALLVQISDLTKQADQIKDQLKDQATASSDAEKVFEGALFRATVVQADRKVVDYKKMLKALGVSDEVVAQYTSVTAVFSVKTTAK